MFTVVELPFAAPSCAKEMKNLTLFQLLLLQLPNFRYRNIVLILAKALGRFQRLQREKHPKLVLSVEELRKNIVESRIVESS